MPRSADPVHPPDQQHLHSGSRAGAGHPDHGLDRGAAVGISLAYILVVEGIIAVVAPQVSQWFPGRVFNTIVGATAPLVGPIPPQGYWAALPASVLWTVGFVVVSALVFPRQDINT